MTAALIVGALTFSPRLRSHQLLALGLVFEVIGSFGIAAAQYLDVSRYGEFPPWGGLSWVAVWMLGFTVMIPSPPRHALAAALGSAPAVPTIVVLAVAIAPAPPTIGVVRFLRQIVTPYLIVVVIAYVGARVVYRLGTELKRARELGAYRLIEPLGFGGMGEVWRADHRLLARPAAVKLIRSDPARAGPAEMAELQARFEREAQALASLRSPHTTQLYDFGVADDGTFYCVMELLEGFDLQTLVERFGPVPPERAARPFDRLALDCLAKDPAQRPADAATLMDAWSRLANGGGWDGAQAQSWWARHGPPGLADSASSHATNRGLPREPGGVEGMLQTHGAESLVLMQHLDQRTVQAALCSGATRCGPIPLYSMS